MNDLQALKKHLQADEELKDKFRGVGNVQEGLDMAQKMGFNITQEELMGDEELSSDLLETVAGGKGPDIKVQGIDVVGIVNGDHGEAEITTIIKQDME